MPFISWGCMEHLLSGQFPPFLHRKLNVGVQRPAFLRRGIIFAVPSIEILNKRATGPSSRKSRDTWVFPSANGMKAVFRNPFEFHMGAYAWEVQVLENGSNKLFSTTGLHCPHPYQPWSFDSRFLFLTSWKEGSFIHEIDSHLSRKLEVSGFVASVLGSQRCPKFLVVTDRGEYLVAIDGGIVRIPAVRRPKYGCPYLSWFDKGRQLFAVENLGAGLARLRFFDAETGDVQTDIPLNPLGLFPYDEPAYANLSRDSYALVPSDSIQCVGSLLDEWSSADFDEASDVLKLMVYRPVGQIFEKRNQQVCKVQQNWVEVRIRPE